MIFAYLQWSFPFLDLALFLMRGEEQANEGIWWLVVNLLDCFLVMPMNSSPPDFCYVRSSAPALELVIWYGLWLLPVHPSLNPPGLVTPPS